MAEQKFKPILFSTPMILAIEGGRKTMTRRTIKPQPECYGDAAKWKDWVSHGPKGVDDLKHLNVFLLDKCPYGKKGDVLWVRESHYRFGSWKKNGTTKTGKQKWRFYPDSGFQNVRYTDNPPAVIEKNSHRSLGWYKLSSLFMTKDACRLFLENGNIRVERLQDISEEDAKAEGIEFVTEDGDNSTFKDYLDRTEWFGSPITSFQSLWQKINGVESWNENPFTWVVSFKKIDKPENFK